ncbi:MAG: FAD-dependent oxidoreductase, partial [Lentisphaeria bacterium]
SRPRELGVPGEAELKAHGVSYCAICDGSFYRDVPICVIGGGDSAMEEAIFLTRFASEVHLVHRRDAFRASSVMANRVLKNEKIIVHWNSVVDEIMGVEGKKVRSIQLKDTKDGHLTEVVCSAVFMAIGHIPSTEVFEGKIALDHGFVLLNGEPSSATSVEGVFAAGDCVDHIYQQAVTAAALGCRAALDAQHWLAAL